MPTRVWQQDWVVNCLPWGQGQQGVLDYLARYVFRIAITERRLLAMDEPAVTFQYKDRKGNCQRNCQLEGTEFVRRFLQHVLPKGFHKVRYYGLWNPRRGEMLQRCGCCCNCNDLRRPKPPSPTEAAQGAVPFGPFAPVCPHCGCEELVHVREIPRPAAAAPSSAFARSNPTIPPAARSFLVTAGSRMRPARPPPRLGRPNASAHASTPAAMSRAVPRPSHARHDDSRSVQRSFHGGVPP